MEEKRKNTSRSSNRVFVWACASMVAVVVMCCCGVPTLVIGGGAFLAGVANANEVSRRDTETLDIGEGIVNLEVTNRVGETRIRGEEDLDEIEIEIVRRATGLTDSRAQNAFAQMTVEVRRDEDRYIIEVADYDDSLGFLEHRSIDLLITVPTHLNMTVTNNVGAMSVRDVEIVDALELINEVGSIEFTGKIGPEGTHRIKNNVGSVEVRVTGESSFRLDASANVGSVDSNLALRDEAATQEDVGNSLTGVYGENADPAATLTITTDVGGIDLRD